MTVPEAQEAPVLTTATLAERWNVTPRTIVSLALSGKLHGIQLGRRWRFSASDIEAFERRPRVMAAPPTTRRPHRSGEIARAPSLRQ